MFASLIALLYTGESIFLWILLFQIVILVTSALNILITFIGVKFIQSVEPGQATKGESVILRLEIHNELFFPFAHLILHYTTPESSFTAVENHIAVSILPRSKEVVETPVLCPYRGEYQLGFSRIEATDLIGLLRVKIPFSVFTSYVPERLIVYPIIRELIPASPVNRELEGKIDSAHARAEELSSIADIRGYRSGDPLKRIHWKLSARNRKLLVKEFEGSLSADSLILLDCTQHGLTGEPAFAFEDTVVECATAFCKRMADDFQPITLVTYSDERTELSGSSPTDFPAFYELLARIKFGGTLNIAAAIKLEQDTSGIPGSLLLITRTPSDELFEKIVTIAESDCHVTIITVLEGSSFDDRMVRMLGEFSLRGIKAYTVFPGENISLKMGGF